MAGLTVAGGLIVAMADPAGACGGLIAPNGAVQLVRTTTLAAWDNGVPVHLVMALESHWVPLHILSLGKPDHEVVEADVFLLTPTEPSLYGLVATHLHLAQAASLVDQAAFSLPGRG